eukprot:gene1165-1335_t
MTTITTTTTTNVYRDDDDDDNWYGKEAEEERVFEEHVVAEEEIEGCKEFFRGTATKTPDRYLRIRNALLAHWHRVRPAYLPKTTARNQLKDCGDVNAIGRVHSFLEKVGAINFGAKRPSRTSHGMLNSAHQRKLLANSGEWMDEEDYYFDHHGHDHGARHTNGHATDYLDPFTLIECSNHTTTNPPPFGLSVTINALTTMDVHAHIATTEVIGMLGGKYDHEHKHIAVHLAIPCNSLSSDIQCDMDPNSLIAARDLVTSMSLEIVGWYHSHPNFPPIPSLRDIETQSAYQKLFGREDIEPFVGVIVNPYHQPAASNPSIFNYVTVSKQLSDNQMYRIPFELVPTISRCRSYPLLTQQIETICRKYQTYQFRMDLMRIYNKETNTSYLEKMVASVRSSLERAITTVDAAETEAATIETALSSTPLAEQHNSLLDHGEIIHPTLDARMRSFPWARSFNKKLDFSKEELENLLSDLFSTSRC